MRDFGLKHTARELAISSGVPVSPGSGLLDSLADARIEAGANRLPVMIKSTSGGGGIGMQLARTADELEEKFESVQRLARSNFKASGLFLEKFIASARHVEVQIFGDGRGAVAVLGERDCSAQRRNQKVTRGNSCALPGRTKCVNGSTKPRDDWVRLPDIAPRAPASSCMMRNPRNSIFLRSTPVCRSSIA